MRGWLILATTIVTGSAVVWFIDWLQRVTPLTLHESFVHVCILLAGITLVICGLMPDEKFDEE